jgi:hypothetical protein
VTGPIFTGMRFPRSMLAGPANERLLEMLGVEIVSDRDCELEDYAWAWLAQMPQTEHRNPNDVPATSVVRRALERIDQKRAA